MNLKKIKIILFLPLALFFIANLFYYPMPAKAVDSSMPTFTIPNLAIDFSGLNEIFSSSQPTACKDDPSKLCINWIGDYIAGIYKYAIGIVGILSAIILMIAGVIWLTAGGNATQITEAKAWITASLTGLIIALCSYTILYQVNPDLLILKPLKITSIAKINMEKAKSSISARESGLAICSINKKAGVKLFLPKQGVKQQNSWWPWMDNLLDDAFNKAFADPATIKKGCTEYCKSMASTMVNVGRFVNDDSAVCCVCKEAPYDRQALLKSIRPKYAFDDGERVLLDASDSLLIFLSCFANESTRLGYGKNTISSIGDTNCIGDLKKCTEMTSVCGNNRTTNCRWHDSSSCHYSNGAGIYKSYAVDFGNGGDDALDSTNQNIKIAAKACHAKFIHKESDHIHISVNPCTSDSNGADY